MGRGIGNWPKTYQVKKGDSFWKIAQNELGDGARYRELASYNGLRADDTIYPGQVLKLPDRNPIAAPTKTYQVKKGDSFWKIAQNELGDGGAETARQKPNRCTNKNVSGEKRG